ncbi:MAG: FG-GAP repeat domain-containing protein, partial [Planctomycetota bacterium]
MNGDGRADILFLRKGDAVLHRQLEGGGFAEAARFPLQYKQRFGAKFESVILQRFLSFNARLARPVLCDANGDKRLDVVTLQDRDLRLYRQNPDGSFSVEPDFTAPLPFLPDDRGQDDTFDQTNLELNDVNQDGKDDLLFFRNVGKLGVFESLKTQVLYYENTGSGWDLKRPNQVINLNGVSMTPALIDIDGDGNR